MRTARITRLARDEGTVLAFEAITEDGDIILLGVDHRMAAPIVVALARGEDVVAEYEPWQVVATLAQQKAAWN